MTHEGKFVRVSGMLIAFLLGPSLFAQDSLSDLPSFREGCRALEDARYETASRHFEETWDTLVSEEAGEVEREFVTTRLLEAWVKNGDAEMALRWLEENPALNPSPTRLRWTAVAFIEQLRFEEAAETLGILRGFPGESTTTLNLDYAFALAMIGEAASAAEILESLPPLKKEEEKWQAALISGKTNDFSGALKRLREVGSSTPAMNRLHLESWFLANLGRTDEAIDLILDAIEDESGRANKIRKILLVHELSQLNGQSIPRERLQPWVTDGNSPNLEAADLLLSLNERDSEKREQRLRRWLEQFPESPYSARVAALADLPEKTVTIHEEALNDLLLEYKSTEAARDFFIGLYHSAEQKFLALADLGTLENQHRSLFNSALAALKNEDFEDFLLREADLKRRLPRSQRIADLTYLAGLFRAARAEPDALNYLQSFIRENPNHLNRIEAQLAIAEIHLNQAPARPQAARQIFESLEVEPLTLQQNERLDYSQVWLDFIDTDESNFTETAETFLREWPRSNYLSEVSMLLGKHYFEENRLDKAKPFFENVAENFPDSPFSDMAALFAAKSNPPGNEAILAWKIIAHSGGPFALEGLHELGLLFLRLDRFSEARTTFREILEQAERGSDLHFAAFADLGYALYLEALAKDQDKELMLKAAETYSNLSRNPEAPTHWKYSAALRRARCLESIGSEEVALEIYRSIVSNSSDSLSPLAVDPSPQGQDWVFRAGFFAIQILREKNDWRSAIQIADELSGKNGPRAIEAANLAEELRLQHWIWE